MKLNEMSAKYFGVRCSGGDRAENAAKWIVVHDTENPDAASARNTALYLHSRPDGSAHEVVGDGETYILARWRTICCGTAGFNTATYHIEQPGRAAWPRRRWMKNFGQLNRVAWRVAWLCSKHRLPPRYRTAKALRAGKPGYTTHLQVTRSNLGTTTHTDPGKNFPLAGRNGFKALVRFWRLKFAIFGLPHMKAV